MVVVVGATLYIIGATGTRIGHNRAAATRFVRIVEVELGGILGTTVPAVATGKLVAELVGHDLNRYEFRVIGEMAGDPGTFVLAAGRCVVGNPADAVPAA